MATTWKVSPLWTQDVLETHHGVLPVGDNSTIGTNLDSWYKFKDLMQKHTTAGKTFSTDIVSTYSLVNTASSFNYLGGVLAHNRDIHFVAWNGNRGQKIAADGTVSTYSLVYTTTDAYQGGLLTQDGDIYMMPYRSTRGQIIHTGSAKNFNLGTCLSPYFNKF